MNSFAERQLQIEPSKFSYKMWKDMPVSMYQSFTFFNLTNWSQVKAVGQKPRFVEVGPYVYRTSWSKSEVQFMDEERLVSFSERKRWHFQAHLSGGAEEDQIWTINTPLMTALALIQNAPVITRNIVSVILDGLGEGAFIKRPVRSLLFDGYSDLIVSVGPLFDRRFANFNGKFAYLYNKNDTLDGTWTVATGIDDLTRLNKISRFQSAIVNMSSLASGQPPQGLNEVKAECAPAWSLDQATNGQLFAPFNQGAEQVRLERQIEQLRARGHRPPAAEGPKRLFGRQGQEASGQASSQQQQQALQERLQQLRDFGKFIFYPDLCRPLHLLPAKQLVVSENGIRAARYSIDPRVFMNSSQVPSNRCYEMNPRPALANALAATLNSVTGANVNVPNLVQSASAPFSMFISPSHYHGHHHHHHDNSLFERTNQPASSFLNNALQTLGASQPTSGEQLAGAASNNAPVSRLGRVRQLFSNIVSQRMSAAGPLLPSLASGPAAILMGGHFPSANARNAPDGPLTATLGRQQQRQQPQHQQPPTLSYLATGGAEPQQAEQPPAGTQSQPPRGPVQPAGGSDRWITQFRFKWPRGVFSIGQCQLGAPIYVSLPHFLDADEYYLEQVDGLKPNRSLHEFYIDVESTLHSVPVGAKARLQLNVATPELRFRNIPNAMIPVLWQEVTFKIDKPVATMLYWSFTMSPTIYKLISALVTLLGCLFMLRSFWGGLLRRRRRANRITAEERRSSSATSCSSSHHSGPESDHSDRASHSSRSSHISQSSHNSHNSHRSHGNHSHRGHQLPTGGPRAGKQVASQQASWQPSMMQCTSQVGPWLHLAMFVC